MIYLQPTAYRDGFEWVPSVLIYTDGANGPWGHNIVRSQESARCGDRLMAIEHAAAAAWDVAAQYAPAQVGLRLPGAPQLDPDKMAHLPENSLFGKRSVPAFLTRRHK